MYYLVKLMFKKGKDAKRLSPTLFFLQVFRNACVWDSGMLSVLKNRTENAQWYDSFSKPTSQLGTLQCLEQSKCFELYKYQVFTVVYLWNVAIQCNYWYQSWITIVIHSNSLWYRSSFPSLKEANSSNCTKLNMAFRDIKKKMSDVWGYPNVDSF